MMLEDEAAQWSWSVQIYRSTLWSMPMALADINQKVVD